MIGVIDWGQVILEGVVCTLIGAAILVVLRWALIGARDTIMQEFHHNGGESMKDKVDATHDEVVALRRDFQNHIVYDHRRRMRS